MLDIKKNIFAILIFVASGVGFVGCSENKPNAQLEKPATSQTGPEKLVLVPAENVIEAFKGASLPMVSIVPKTAESDPNKLLGRPHQYIEKIDFKDKRVKDGEVYVETFNNLDDLQSRFEYVDEIAKKMPMVAQYQIKHKNVLVRLDKEFTPAQVAEYEKALKGL